MMSVTHDDLDRVRRELHSDHSGLSAAMADSFTRVYLKLDDAAEKRARGIRWVVGVTFTLFSTLVGLLFNMNSTFGEHLQHSAKYTERIEHHDDSIAKLEDWQEKHEH